MEHLAVRSCVLWREAEESRRLMHYAKAMKVLRTLTLLMLWGMNCERQENKTLDIPRSNFHPVSIRIDYASTIHVSCDLAAASHGGAVRLTARFAELAQVGRQQTRDG